MKESCFHITFDKPCGYGEKLQRLQLYVYQTFGKHFVLFFFLLTTLLVQKIQNLIKRTFLFFVPVYVATNDVILSEFYTQHKTNDWFERLIIS